MKMYFEVGDWEQCYPLDYFMDRINDGEKEVHLNLAVIDRGGDGMWCKVHGEIVERGRFGDCGKLCKYYDPCNGKSGRCRQLANCYTDTGGEFILTKDGLSKVNEGDRMMSDPKLEDWKEGKPFGYYKIRNVVKRKKCSYHFDKEAVCESHQPSHFLLLCRTCAGWDRNAMNPSEDVKKRIKELGKRYDGTTHWEGCWENHLYCAYEKYIKELEAEIKRLHDTFKHTHVAGTTKGLDIDTCAECGLDLRNEIHLREGAK